MSAPPFMQLYVADYLGDTRHLSTEQHGAYLLLLMTMWRAGGSLPNDPKKLARIAGCGPARWEKICDDVMAFFEVGRDEIVSARLSQELEKASQKSQKRSEAGAKGGSAKSLKTNATHEAIATLLPKHSSEPESERKGEAIASLLPDPFDGFWLAYPLKVGKPKARAAYEAAIKRIAKAARATDPPLTIMTGLLAWIPVWTDPKFTPHPTTWLNRDGWNDTPPEQHHERSHQGPTKRDDRLQRMFAGAMAAADE